MYDCILIIMYYLKDNLIFSKNIISNKKKTRRVFHVCARKGIY